MTVDLTSGFQTLLAAMTPLGELRFSIPLAIYQLNLPWYQALAWSLIGNMVPVFPLIWGMEHGGGRLERSANRLGRLLHRRAERLRATQGRRFQKYGALALAAFVGVPLPFTGAWSGVLAAWVFQIPARQAIPAIALGVLGAGIIVTIVTVTGAAIGRLILVQ